MSQKLYNLVQSLNKAEKRNFKLFAGTESSAYMHLYKALEKEKKYTDVKLRRKFRHQTDTAFSKTKELLTNSILESLLYHHRNSNEVYILNKLAYINILRHKNQVKLMQELIDDTRQKILDLERYYLLAYLLQTEIDYLRIRKLKSTDVETFHKKLTTLIEVSDKAKNLSEYRLYTFTAQHLRVFHGSTERVPEYRNYMEQTKNNTLFKNKNKALSIIAIDEYFGFWFWYYEMQNQPKKQVQIVLEWLDIYNKKTAGLPKAIGRLIVILYRLGVAAIASGNTKVYNNSINQIISLKPTSEEYDFEKWNNLFSLKLEKLYAEDNQKEGIQLQPIYEKLTTLFACHLSDERRVSITKEMCIAHFLNSNYDVCISLSGDILNRLPNIHFHSQCQLRIINIFSHLALGNNQLLPNLYRSFQYFVNQNSTLTEIEKTVKNIITDLAKTTTTKQTKVIYKKYYALYKENSENRLYFFLPHFFETHK